MLNLFKKKPQGEEITFNIKGMHCTSCAININGALEDTEGVINSDTNYAKAQVTVLFNPDEIDQQKLTKIIEAEGYIVVTE